MGRIRCPIKTGNQDAIQTRFTAPIESLRATYRVNFPVEQSQNNLSQSTVWGGNLLTSTQRMIHAGTVWRALVATTWQLGGAAASYRWKCRQPSAVCASDQSSEAVQAVHYAAERRGPHYYLLTTDLRDHVSFRCGW